MKKVPISKADYVGRGEIYTEFFKCGNCTYREIYRDNNYCAECGSELKWEITDEELYELQCR